MTQKGAKIEKVKIKYFQKDHRGICATEDIKKGDVLVFVPKSLLLTYQRIIEDCPLCKKISEQNMISEDRRVEAAYCAYIMV